MKCIAVVEADFNVTPIGTRSRLLDVLPTGAGEDQTILRRTVRRLLLSRRISRVHVTVRVSDKPQADEALKGLNVAIETHDAPHSPWMVPVATGGRLASARKWSLDGWRGGLCGYGVFDETFNPWLYHALAGRESADAVMPVPSAAPLIDPAMIDAVLDHFEKVHTDVRLAFTPAPPGLVAPVYLTPMLDEMCKLGCPPGRLIAYHPNDPQRDLVMRDCCCRPDLLIEQSSGRLIADTDRSVRRIEAILNSTAGRGDVPDGLTIARWLSQEDGYTAGALPREVEIELTTQDQLTQTTLRPRGACLGRSGEMNPALLDRLFSVLSTLDDSLVVFGGFGEPLLHPQFTEIVRKARDAGIYGIAVRTNALDLDADRINALLDARVDVVSVLLDAHTADLYAKVHHCDGYDRAVTNVQALLNAIRDRKEYRVIVAPEMIKTHDTMWQMEAFYDDWLRRTEAAVITGPARYGGLLPDMAVMNMASPRRAACRRLWSRLMVLSDGRVTMCDQDARGEHAIGNLNEASLGALWTGARMTQMRSTHRAGDYSVMPLCSACREWHRP